VSRQDGAGRHEENGEFTWARDTDGNRDGSGDLTKPWSGCSKQPKTPIGLGVLLRSMDLLV
jgi:hypothetical protein